MKLFLTSAGLTNQAIAGIFLAQLPLPALQCRVLVVAYAQNPEEEYYINQSKEEIQRLGLDTIVVANMHDSVDVSSLGDFNVIYVCGGNTFAILQKLRQTTLDTFIIQQVQGGAIYIGVSAGSIIAGPSIEIAGWGSAGDENKVGLEDLSGFNLIDLTVFPHFHEKLRSDVEEFKKRVPYPVFELTNDQAVFVNDSEVMVLGDTSEQLIARAKALQTEAGRILESLDLFRVIGAISEPEIVGSAKNGLMTMPDIDIHAWMEESSLGKVADMLSTLAKMPTMQKVQFNNYRELRRDDRADRVYFPHAHYVGLRTVQPSGEWNIDIWFGKRGTMDDYDASELDAITDAQRLTILRLKEAWKGSKRYRDGVISTDFYKAVMRHDVKDANEFSEYMKTKEFTERG